MALPVDHLAGLGPKSRMWLAEVGIDSEETLRKLGAAEAYGRLRFHFGTRITRNMLHALAAAIAGTDRRMLSLETKRELDLLVQQRFAAHTPIEK